MLENDTPTANWHPSLTQNILGIYEAIIDAEYDSPNLTTPLRGLIADLRSLAGYYIRRDKTIYDAWTHLEAEKPGQKFATPKAILWERFRFLHHVYHQAGLYDNNPRDARRTLGSTVLHAYAAITHAEKRGNDDVLYGIINLLRCIADPYMAPPPWIPNEEPSPWLHEWWQIARTRERYTVPKAQRWQMRDLLHEIFVEAGLLANQPLGWAYLSIEQLLTTP